MATGLENQVQQTVGVPYGKQATIPLSSSFPPEAEKRGAVLITQK
ncbi:MULTISPECIES: hypothetical protein [Nostoc]|nr:MULTISPECIES: hypothetical protein [Nostoc]